MGGWVYLPKIGAHYLTQFKNQFKIMFSLLICLEHLEQVTEKLVSCNEIVIGLKSDLKVVTRG